MGNRHIKTINGRKYYYESIRKGKKVTSRYLGPVEEKIKVEQIQDGAVEQVAQETKEEAQQVEENYIG